MKIIDLSWNQPITIFFQEERKEHVDLHMEYDSTGSSVGKKRITGEIEPEVDFAGSDSLPGDSDYELLPDLTVLPTMAG